LVMPKTFKNSRELSVLPQSQQNYEESDAQKDAHLYGQITAKWGEKNSVNVQIDGKPAATQEWRQMVEGREEQVPTFVNAYLINTRYSLEKNTAQKFRQWFELVKAYNYWNIRVQERDGQEGFIRTLAIINPIDRNFVNVSVQTPYERVLIDSIQLPFEVTPFSLVGRQRQSIHSVGEMFSNIATEGFGAQCKVDDRRIRTFDGVSYKAPLSKCYTVLAKDCSSEKPEYAVLMKQTNANKKVLKVVLRQRTIEVESKDDKLQIKINGERTSDKNELADNGVEVIGERREVIISAKAVTVRFDGEEARVKVSSLYKNGQCGLCGHFDEETDNEFRMSNNELTEDIGKFHRSYALQGDCDSEEMDNFYEKERQNFQLEEQRPRSSKNNLWEDEESDEEDFISRRRQQKYSGRQSTMDDQEDTQEPIEITKVAEFNHKVCFSTRPVKQCPEGTYASEEDLKTIKTPYVCLRRTNQEMRRIKNLVETKGYVESEELAKFSPSFVDSVQIPSRCLVHDRNHQGGRVQPQGVLLRTTSQAVP
jgi:hypothetical protein